MNKSILKSCLASAAAAGLLLATAGCSQPSADEVCPRYAQLHHGYHFAGEPDAPITVEELESQCTAAYEDEYASKGRCIMNAESWSDVEDKCM